MKKENTKPVEQSEEFEWTAEEENEFKCKFWESKAKEYRDKIKTLEEKYVFAKYGDNYKVFGWKDTQPGWADPKDLKAAKKEASEAEYYAMFYKGLLEPLPDFYQIFNALGDANNMLSTLQSAMSERVDWQPNTNYVVHLKSANVAVQTGISGGTLVSVKALSKAEFEDFKELSAKQGKKIVHYSSQLDVDLGNITKSLPGFELLEIRQIVIDHKVLNREMQMPSGRININPDGTTYGTFKPY